MPEDENILHRITITVHSPTVTLYI